MRVSRRRSSRDIAGALILRFLRYVTHRLHISVPKPPRFLVSQPPRDNLHQGWIGAALSTDNLPSSPRQIDEVPDDLHCIPPVPRAGPPMEFSTSQAKLLTVLPLRLK